MKISMSGPAGAGKDFVATKLAERYCLHPLSLAAPMKEIVAGVTGLTVEEVNAVKEGNYTEATLRKLPNLMQNNPEAGKARMRKMLQMLGTEVFRDNWSDRVWIDHLLRRVDRVFEAAHLTNEQGVVVTDTRFPNEFSALKQAGFLMVYVDCPPEFKRAQGEAAKHPSETAILPLVKQQAFHVYIYNDRKTPVENLVEHITRELPFYDWT